MSDVHDALDRACHEVGIVRPSHYRDGQWAKTDTHSGRNGKGDGRVIVNERNVTAFNWQTGEKATVWFGDERERVDHAQLVRERREAARLKQERRQRAEAIAGRLLETARVGTHPYLARKGFAAERAPTIGAEAVAAIGGKYLVPEEGSPAVAMLVPCRIGERLSSVQLIWEDGTKKFLFGGDMGGACHRIAAGRDTWLCEGYATALSLRTALRAMNRRDGVLCCFSAYNITVVAERLAAPGRCFIAADNDKPLPQYGGRGAGEHYSRLARLPFALPPELGQDINDMHQRDGIFAVQRLLGSTIREANR